MPKRSQPARDDVEIGEPQVVSAGRPVANTPSWLVLVLLINIAATAAGVWFGITELISLRATVEEQQRKYEGQIATLKRAIPGGLSAGAGDGCDDQGCVRNAKSHLPHLRPLAAPRPCHHRHYYFAAGCPDTVE